MVGINAHACLDQAQVPLKKALTALAPGGWERQAGAAHSRVNFLQGWLDFSNVQSVTGLRAFLL